MLATPERKELPEPKGTAGAKEELRLPGSLGLEALTELPLEISSS
jgi:hypothetical protein